MPIEIPKCPQCGVIMAVDTSYVLCSGGYVTHLRVHYKHSTFYHSYNKEEGYEIDGKEINPNEKE